ncbi:1-acyl-sn-glycerol-3-phosphate acyltransferase [bacterium]|nr:1-acyl-sn-glycerol-3-phosphate acyltransferase [bacterium]MBU1989871.1 1-acyl-sn-glycerol-3-phosphate acyltransferase [bacterium]
MNLKKIEERVLELCPYVKEIEVVLQDDAPFARIRPNFEALKSAHIINIESEIRWYGIELYNMEVKDFEKIKGYELFSQERTPQQEIPEPEDELYQILKSFVSALSDAQVSASAHLELDLGLDSLDYVELFTFVEESFGVPMDEAVFSEIMNLGALYAYIKKHRKHSNPVKIDWEKILAEPTDEKLLYSPLIMFAYKTVLLPLFKLYFRLECGGKENIPRSACIFAPSHQSMLDGFLIEASLPYKVLKNSFFLAYEAVFGTKFLRPVSDHGQTLLIDADKNLKRSMLRAALPLREGKNLVIFPEGARSRDRKLLEFRPFFAMLSKTYNVPIVPVVLDGSYEALSAGKLFPRPKKIRIKFLEPIYPENLSYDAMSAKVKDAIDKDMKLHPLSV